MKDRQWQKSWRHMDSARVKLLLLQVWTEYFQGICCLRLGLILSQTTQAENITSKKAVGGRQTKLCRGRMVDCFSNLAFLGNCNCPCNHQRGPWGTKLLIMQVRGSPWLTAPPRNFWNPWLCKRELVTTSWVVPDWLDPIKGERICTPWSTHHLRTWTAELQVKTSMWDTKGGEILSFFYLSFSFLSFSFLSPSCSRLFKIRNWYQYCLLLNSIFTPMASHCPC